MLEIASKRGKNSKVYSLGNGRERFVTGGGICHYRDDSGVWQDADAEPGMDFIPPELLSAGWTHYFDKFEWRVLIDNNKGRIAILPTRGNNEKYVLFRAHPTNNVSINVELLNNTTIRCWRVGPNETYNFLIGPQSIKPYVYLYNSGAVKSWTLGFKLQNLDRIGRKIFDGQKEVGILPDSYITGSDGEQREATETITDSSATVSWEHSGMSFPVVVDPTFTVKPSTADVELNANNPTVPMGTTTTLNCGVGAGGLARRMVLSFDFSSFVGRITAAYLDLNYGSFLGSDPVGRAVKAYNLTQTGWIEAQATWNVYKTGSNWATAGGDYAVTYEASAVYPAAPALVTWDVTSHIGYWYSNGMVAHLLVKDTTESGPQTSGNFFAKEYATASLRPALRIDYETITGGKQISIKLRGKIKL